MRYVIIYAPGPAWSDGATINRQPFEEHLAYMHLLHKEQRLVFGGPFTDDAGGVAVVEATSRADVDHIVARDPAIIDEVFTLAAVHPLHVAFRGVE